MAENYTVSSALMINSVNVSTLLSFLFPNVDLFFLPANLVLEDTVERIYHENAFAENFHGLFLIRGENVVLLGEIVRPNLHARLEQNLNSYYTGSR
jgi:hypothetical protein